MTAGTWLVLLVFPVAPDSLAAQGSHGEGGVAIPSVLLPGVSALSGTWGEHFVPSGTQFSYQ